MGTPSASVKAGRTGYPGPAEALGGPGRARGQGQTLGSLSLVLSPPCQLSNSAVPTSPCAVGASQRCQDGLEGYPGSSLTGDTQHGGLKSQQSTWRPGRAPLGQEGPRELDPEGELGGGQGVRPCPWTWPCQGRPVPCCPQEEGPGSVSHSPDAEPWRPEQSWYLAQGMLVDKGRGGPGKDGPQTAGKGQPGLPGLRIAVMLQDGQGAGSAVPQDKEGFQSHPSGQETKVLAPASGLGVCGPRDGGP